MNEQQLRESWKEYQIKNHLPVNMEHFVIDFMLSKFAAYKAHFLDELIKIKEEARVGAPWTQDGEKMQQRLDDIITSRLLE